MLWLVGLALIVAIAAAVFVSLFCDADLTTVLCELLGHKSNIRNPKLLKNNVSSIHSDAVVLTVVQAGSRLLPWPGRWCG